MRFSDQPSISARAKIGCLTYGIVGAFLSGTLMIGAALGDCAPNEDGSGCEHDGLIKFAMFPGSLIIFIGVGILLAFCVTRDRS